MPWGQSASLRDAYAAHEEQALALNPSPDPERATPAAAARGGGGGGSGGGFLGSLSPGRGAGETLSPGRLSPYDVSLLQDRNVIPLPRNGFSAGPPSGAQKQFEPVTTLRGVALFMLCCGAYLGLLYWRTRIWPATFTEDNRTSAEVSVNMVLQIFAAALHRYLRHLHKQKKKTGYLEFYLATRYFSAAPFLVLTAGNLFFLLAALWPHVLRLKDDAIIRIVASVEMGVIFLAMLVYARIVLLHNRQKKTPDAHGLLESISSLHTPLLYTVDQGLGLDSVTEEQAELIRFLQTRVSHLNREVMRLQSKISKSKLQGDGPDYPDADALLASKDQEIRALNGDREALKAELKAGKKALAEKDQDLQKLQLLNSQHLEENSRLRSIIHEWSLRNAKLEQKLAQLKLAGTPGRAERDRDERERILANAQRLLAAEGAEVGAEEEAGGAQGDRAADGEADGEADGAAGGDDLFDDR